MAHLIILKEKKVYFSNHLESLPQTSLQHEILIVLMTKSTPRYFVGRESMEKSILHGKFLWIGLGVLKKTNWIYLYLSTYLKPPGSLIRWNSGLFLAPPMPLQIAYHCLETTSEWDIGISSPKIPMPFSWLDCIIEWIIGPKPSTPMMNNKGDSDSRFQSNLKDLKVVVEEPLSKMEKKGGSIS